MSLACGLEEIVGLRINEDLLADEVDAQASSSEERLNDRRDAEEETSGDEDIEEQPRGAGDGDEPAGNRLKWPKESANQLKLSVGGDTDTEEDEENGDDAAARNEHLRANMADWHRQYGSHSRNEDFADDFNVELTSERIKEIIAGGILFPAAQGQIEEVFAEKKPKILNGFLFGEVIGEGSYAKVKEVVEEMTLVRRAVKIIKANRLRKIPNGVENVDREIKILRKVNHPNVIRLIQVFRDDIKNKLYMVMEFCMGSVQQLLDSAAEKRLPEPEAHRYFRELIVGLEYLHSIGIVHKDIKPGNLLLSPDFALKISDFGVAEELSLFQCHDLCQLVQGTPKFQAPELVSGSTKEFHGFKADVWSCGVSLYNMISGEYPFEGEVIMRLFDNIAKQELVMPTKVSVGVFLETLLRGLMNKDPLQRFDLEQIKNCEWYRKIFSKESLHSPFPDRKKSVYRPLTVHSALEQMYGPPPADRLIYPPEVEADMTVTSDRIVAAAPRRNRSLLSCLKPNRSP